MGDVKSFAIAVSGGTPANTDTVVLFNSVTAFGTGGFRHNKPARISFAVENSHSGTLKAYRSTNSGTNWDQVADDIAVAVATSTDINGPYDFLVDTYLDFKLEFTTSATQTTWRAELHGHNDRQPGT
jgi:hypothetical protein